MRLPEKTHKLLFDALFSSFHPQWVPGEDFASRPLNFYKTQHTIEQAFCFFLSSSILFYRRSNGEWFRLLKFWQDYALFSSADAKVSLNCGTCYRNIFLFPSLETIRRKFSPQSVQRVITGRHLFVFVPFASFFPFLQCVSVRFKCPKRLSRWYMDLICMKISVC